MLQICLIHSVLYQGGYSHNDLHTDNIMVNPTDQSHFKFANANIPFFGLKLTSIDYGNVLHSKFKIEEPWAKFFVYDRKKFLFDETFESIMIIVSNKDKYVYQCDKKKPIQSSESGGFDDTVQKILVNHTDFFLKYMNKYLHNYKGGADILDVIIKNKSKPFSQFLDGQNGAYDAMHVIDRIVYAFTVLHPKLYAKYFGWCSYHRSILPVKDVLNILELTTTKKLINYCLKKLK
jgi:hypothetical protein